jgi:transcriptional regulator with XRE-family HTH domain/Zn-dependent peptidase ImmA (M78 family)
MIANERQYRITKAESEKFRRTLEQLEADQASKKDVHPRLLKAQRDAVQSQVDELLEELREYERLKAGDVGVIQIDSLDELGDGLIKGRIASGMSQRELAEKLHLKEQQIQRYEAERYASASYQRLQQVAHAIGMEVRKELLLPVTPKNMKTLMAKLSQTGLESDFFCSKLLPTTDLARLEGKISDIDEQALVGRAAEIAGRIFGWSQDELFAPAPLNAPRFAAAEARFKMPAGKRQKSTSLYAAYANYLAVLVLRECENLPREPIPVDPEAFRELFATRYQTLTLKSALHFAWDLGVPVLPLRDRGTFHGACWRYDFQNVIVLKQTSRHLSRWLFDLLHELYHAGQNPDQATLEVVEMDENSEERRNSDEEIAASQFAGDIVLNGKADDLAQKCVELARNSVERLKSVVPEVAQRHDVDVGALANYLAFRLSWQGINWWGAAANLQKSDESPWEVARDVFCERFPFGKSDHNRVDQQLLALALQ